jgi:hypothetical protein
MMGLVDMEVAGNSLLAEKAPLESDSLGPNRGIENDKRFAH